MFDGRECEQLLCQMLLKCQCDGNWGMTAVMGDPKNSSFGWVVGANI